MNEQQLKLLWYQALAEPIGLLLEARDVNFAKQRLYQARAKLGDPDLAQVQIRTSPVEGGNLLLIRETVSVPAISQQPADQEGLTEL